MQKLSTLVSFAIILAFTQCNSTSNSTINGSDSYSDSTAQPIDSLSSMENPSTNVENQLDSLVDGHILLPASYRIWKPSEAISRIIDSTWLALYKNGDQYFIGKINYQIEHAAEEPCSGLPTETIVPEHQTYAFFNLREMKAGAIDSISIEKPVLNPNESSCFSFNGKKYSIKASGRAFDDRDKNGVGVYKLELFEDDRFARVILQQDQYNDTHTEIQLIGDFDKDGKPDFLFSSPRDYEEERVIINLSNSPYAFEGNRQFDC
ncbi:hypothetical protein [Sphingobacterium hotanense]|uniref:hypothetical protein n=1 Tax=Sphingobacterium hotanense TaxID=649196 RepID=UPI0011F37255|nr:hypothetical protein [Sphingobacterium hotanense]